MWRAIGSCTLRRPRRISHAGRRGLLALLACVVCCGAQAYGPVGHRVAGLAAQALLCKRAAAAIDALTPGEGLDELGLWADRVRDDRRWAQSAPWHYMNIADGASVERYRDPPEGDVLWAIRHFRSVLADVSQSNATRATALRFLVHFIVDVHQPLHVGRASDRGGNTITVRYDAGTVSLHRFWDNEAIGLGERSPAAYAATLAVRLPHGEAELDPAVWAAESLALRPQVYDFDASREVLPAAYVRRARAITKRRLAQAAGRLAATLNAIWCDE